MEKTMERLINNERLLYSYHVKAVEYYIPGEHEKMRQKETATVSLPSSLSRTRTPSPTPPQPKPQGKPKGKQFIGFFFDRLSFYLF